MGEGKSKDFKRMYRFEQIDEKVELAIVTIRKSSFQQKSKEKVKILIEMDNTGRQEWGLKPWFQTAF